MGVGEHFRCNDGEGKGGVHREIVAATIAYSSRNKGNSRGLGLGGYDLGLGFKVKVLCLGFRITIQRPNNGTRAVAYKMNYLQFFLE